MIQRFFILKVNFIFEIVMAQGKDQLKSSGPYKKKIKIKDNKI